MLAIRNLHLIPGLELIQTPYKLTKAGADYSVTQVSRSMMGITTEWRNIFIDIIFFFCHFRDLSGLAL